MTSNTQQTEGKFRKFWVKSVNNYITDADYNGKKLKDRNPIPSFREFHFIKSEDDLNYFSKRDGISNAEIVEKLLNQVSPNSQHPDTDHDTAQTDQQKANLWWSKSLNREQRVHLLNKYYPGNAIITQDMGLQIWYNEIEFGLAPSVEEGSGRTIEQIQNMWNCDKAALAELGRKLTETEKLKDDLNYFLLKWVNKYERDYPTLSKSGTDTLYIETVEVLKKANKNFKP
jgi:hypothetical protein